MFKFIFNFYNLYKLRTNLYKSYAEIERLQSKKLKSLFYHAYYNVDYYNRLFKSVGIKPEDIQDLKDLERIPFSSKKDLQSFTREMITAKNLRLKPYINIHTSGSTGEPMDIYISKEELNLRHLFYLRMYFENGGRLFDKQLRITNPYYFGRKRWYEFIGILKTRYVSIFDNIETIAKFILKYNPDIIRGYPSYIKDIAIEIKKKKIKGIAPRLIFTVGELLSKKDKESISSVFQSEVIDYYSANECGIIAWECNEHTGYHINSDSIIVEFIKENGMHARPGEEGEIVITSLDSYTMPFIRYRLGDVGILCSENCPCGITFPLMKIITGRVNDYIILPNGKKISPYILMEVMDGISEIEKYQIVQEARDTIKINILKNEMITEEIINKIIKNYKKLLGNEFKIKPLILKDMHIDKNTGKFKTVLSMVSRDCSY